MRPLTATMALVVAAVAVAAPAAALTFDEALERAAASPDRVALVMDRLDAARADERIAVGAVVPTAQINAQHTLAPSTPGIDPTTANVRVVADLVRAQAVAAWRAQRTLTDAAREQARWDVAGLRYAAAQAYVGALAARANLEAADSAVVARSASLQQAVWVEEAGYGLASDVSRARVSALEAETVRLDAEIALQDALDWLAFVVDLDRVDADELEEPGVAIASGSEAEDNASLRSLALQRAAMDALVRAQWLGFAPVVSFVAGYRIGAESFRDPGGESVFAVVTATWSLFDFGRYGRLDRARAERDSADASLRLAARQRDLDIAAAERRLESAGRRVELAQQALALAATTRDVEGERYAGGDATALDLVTADAEVLRTEVARNLAVLEQSSAAIELAYVRGALEDPWP